MVTVPTLQNNSGRPIPVIGLGLMLFGTPERTPELTYQGLKQGFRLLDTAQAYGNEALVAEGIARWIKEDPEHNKREDVIYTTKIFDPDHGYEKTKKAVELSLERAKAIGYIDMVLMHSPQSDYEKRHGSWMALQEFVAAGKIKQLGVSNYGIKHLEELFAYPDLTVKPCMNQLNLFPWLVRPKLTAWCREHGIVPEAYSPLVKGRKMDDPDLTRLAAKYGKTKAQILLRWSVQMGYAPIPRTSKVERVVENFDIFDFELAKEDVDVLTAKDEYLILGWDPSVYPLDSEKKEGQELKVGTWAQVKKTSETLYKENHPE